MIWILVSVERAARGGAFRGLRGFLLLFWLISVLAVVMAWPVIFLPAGFGWLVQIAWCVLLLAISALFRPHNDDHNELEGPRS